MHRELPLRHRRFISLEYEVPKVHWILRADTLPRFFQQLCSFLERKDLPYFDNKCSTSSEMTM